MFGKFRLAITDIVSRALDLQSEFSLAFCTREHFLAERLVSSFYNSNPLGKISPMNRISLARPFSLKEALPCQRAPA